MSLLQKPGLDLADGYISFVRQNQDILRERISDELYTQKVFDVSMDPETHQHLRGGGEGGGRGQR